MKNIDDRTLNGHRLLDVLPAGIALIDENEIIRHVNAWLISMTGFDHDEMVGQHVTTFVPVRHHFAYRRARRARDVLHNSGVINSIEDLTILRRDGSELAIGLSVAPFKTEGEDWTVVAMSDESVQRAAMHAMHTLNEALSESEGRVRLAFEENMAPMIYSNSNDEAIAVNRAFCNMLGRTKEEILGRDSKSFTYPTDIGITEEAHGRLTSGESTSTRYVKRYVRADGQVLVVECSKSPAHGHGDGDPYFLTSQRDVTDRVQREQTLGLLASVNRLAMVAVNEDEFRQALCDLLIADGRYLLAWIARESDSEDGGVDVMCAAGSSEYLFGDMTPWWGSLESGQGQAGAALRTGDTQVVGDLTRNAVNDPWRRRAADFDFGSSVSIPEQVNNHKVALNIYARDVLEFDELTVQGLEEVMRAAEFAVTHVRSVRQTERLLSEMTDAVSSLRATESALGESEMRFRLAFEDNMAPMIFSDIDDLAIGVNDAFCEMVGFGREELLGRDSVQFTHPDDFGVTEGTHERLVTGEITQARYIKRYLRKDGRVIISEISRSAARDENDEILYFVSSERDVTEEHALTTQLSQQALHDPLTGLANRILFEDRLSQAHAKVQDHGGLGALYLLDLDDFKGVNDAHGHFVGDQLLVALARRLESVAHPSNSVCRFGGDVFLFLVDGLASQDDAEEIALRLLDVMIEPFTIAGNRIEQRASIGVVLWDETVSCSDELIQNADAAMYEAKRKGKGHHTFFTPRMHQEAVDRFALTQELRHALSAGELSMHYQPIVDLATTTVVGFESLMRWEHPIRGWVPPAVFIPLAEQSELILELGAFALREAVSAASSWQDSTDGDGPYVTVNLSAHQFHDPNLLTMIPRELREAGLAPSKLVIEVTESVTLLDVAETSSVIESLSRQGIGIALDDFGTGYSSLSYLTQLQPRILKIDQSFVRPAVRTDRNDAVLETIVALGQKLGMIVLAEGIETPDQLRRLRFLGCDLGQGYLFSPAVPADQAKRLLNSSL